MGLKADGIEHRAPIGRPVQLRDERTIDQAIDDRIKGLTDWILENAPECSKEQRHLGEEAVERGYWHYGYLVALRDLRELLRGNRNTLN
jgi:hypothetical protein